MTRFIAFDLPSYDTWRMRLTLTLLILIVAAISPRPAAAFDLEATLKAQHIQYQGEPDYSVTQSDGMSLSQATASVRRRANVDKILGAATRVQGGREVHHIKVLLKDGTVKTFKVNGRRR